MKLEMKQIGDSVDASFVNWTVLVYWWFNHINVYDEEQEQEYEEELT